MSIIKFTPRTVLLFIAATTAILGSSVCVVNGDVGALRGGDALRDGIEKVLLIEETTTIIEEKKLNEEEVDVFASEAEVEASEAKTEAEGETEEATEEAKAKAEAEEAQHNDISDRIHKNFNTILNQKKTTKQLKAMSPTEKAYQQSLDNWDDIMNQQGTTDWGYTGLSKDEIEALREQIFSSRVILQAKLSKEIFIQDLEEASEESSEEAKAKAEAAEAQHNDISDRIHKNFNAILNQEKSTKQLEAMSPEEKALQQSLDNWDEVLNNQGTTDWGYTGLTPKEIEGLREQIFTTRVQLQAKLSQDSYIQDHMTQPQKGIQQLLKNWDEVLNHQGRDDWKNTGLSDDEINTLRSMIRDSSAAFQAKLLVDHGFVMTPLPSVVTSSEEDTVEVEVEVEVEVDTTEVDATVVDDSSLDCVYMYQSEDDLEDDLKSKTTTTHTINNNILDLDDDDDDDLFTPSEEVSEDNYGQYGQYGQIGQYGDATNYGGDGVASNYGYGVVGRSSNYGYGVVSNYSPDNYGYGQYGQYGDAGDSPENYGSPTNYGGRRGIRVSAKGA